MAEVVFYVLNSTSVEEKNRFTCKLVNKIVKEQRRADILLPTEQTAEQLDLMLWDFKPEAFVPHAINFEAPAPIQLFVQTITRPCQDVLVNLHSEFQPQFQNYQRVIEILDQTEHLIQLGRQRFKQYRALGFEPTVHKIGY